MVYNRDSSFYTRPSTCVSCLSPLATFLPIRATYSSLLYTHPMGLFSRKAKDSSGSPIAVDQTSDIEGPNDVTHRRTTLHKRQQHPTDGTFSPRSRSAPPYATEEETVPINGVEPGHHHAEAGYADQTNSATSAGGVQRDFATEQGGVVGTRKGLWNRHHNNNVTDGRPVGNVNGLPGNSHQSAGIGHRNEQGQAGSEPDTIEGAHAKLRAAKEAEETAFGLVAAARAASNDARETIERLHAQAEEEARLAAIKQKEAKGLRQETQVLGRV